MSRKCYAPLLAWRLNIRCHYSINFEPARYIPHLWNLHIWAQLKETIWKHLFSSLPLGQHCLSVSELGHKCRCGSIMSLDHIWSSCPSYDLCPLLDATNTHLSSIIPGVYIKHTDMDGSSLQWTSLLILHRLDVELLQPWHQDRLRDALPLREWTIGSLLWIIWKCRNHEIYGTNYVFSPADALPALLAAFQDFHISF